MPGKRVNLTDSTLLGAIVQFWDENGYSPSIRELCERVGIASTCAMRYRLQKLEAGGLISRQAGKARTVTVTDNGRAIACPPENIEGLPVRESPEVHPTGERLAWARRNAGLTQAQVGKAVGLSQSTLSKYEIRGARVVGWYLWINKLCGLYGASLAWIVTGNERSSDSQVRDEMSRLWLEYIPGRRRNLYLCAWLEQLEATA